MLAAYSQGNVPERPGGNMLASIFRNYIMTVKELIAELKTWPKHYKVEDEHWNPVEKVRLSRCSGGPSATSGAIKGTIWIGFKKKICKHCSQEIK